MGNFAKDDVVFELGDIIFEWEVLFVVSQVIASFLTSMWINDVLKLAWKVVHVLSDGGVSARAFLVKVDAQIAADPSFIKDKAKAMFFLSES